MIFSILFFLLPEIVEDWVKVDIFHKAHCAGVDCLTAGLVVLAVTVLYFSLKWFMKGPECQSKARSTIRSLMWKYFAVQFVRENCHHHWSNLRSGEGGRHEPEHEGSPGDPGVQVGLESCSTSHLPPPGWVVIMTTSASLGLELLGTTIEEDQRVQQIIPSW